MAKLRVYELAKELSMESREVIRRLGKMGLELKNHMSMVEDKFADKLREMVKPNPKSTQNSANSFNPVTPRQESGRGDKQGRKIRKADQNQVASPNKKPHDRFRGPKPSMNNKNKPERPSQSGPEKVKSVKPASPVGEKRSKKRSSETPNKILASKTNDDNNESHHGSLRGKNKPFNKGENVKGKSSRFKQKPEKNFRAGGRNKGPGKHGKKGYQQKIEHQPVTPKKVVIGESVIVQELAKGMGKTAAEVIRKLMDLGILATINQEIDADTATIVAGEFGVPIEVRVDKTMEILEDQEDAEELLVERPPVVTVMGHVDHGKTSLLDAIREANVIATEAGGITQHIGAYQVKVNNRKITFIDTPGHEAFTAMRARGAQVTDIAIVVVAADDGVMPQTVEAINHSKAAKVPIIVAINKIDKPTANSEKVKQELTEYGLVPEEWGGDTIMVPVSAKTHEGINHLLEMILLVAEMAELKVNPDRVVRGTVIEAELDKGRGPVATVLVQKGTLRIGNNIVAGTAFGKVRAMIDDKGRRVKSAGPSTPVEVLGFSEIPPVGEIFISVEDEKDARHIASKHQLKRREEELSKTARVSLDDLFKQISEGNVKELNIIVKGDVHGSVEALSQSLKNLSTDEVRINIIHSGVGTITESDVMLAAASNAIIIGFNVRPDANTRKAAENEKVDLKLYRVIYDAIDDIKAAMAGLLDPSYKEVVIGRAEVRATFKVPKVGVIAGSYVTEGKITRQSGVRIIRDGIVIHEGRVESLKRFKDDAKEVLSGYECGIGIENFNDLKVGDIIEGFIMEEATREL